MKKATKGQCEAVLGPIGSLEVKYFCIRDAGHKGEHEAAGFGPDDAVAMKKAGARIGTSPRRAHWKS
jgi:hypothetical protein